MFKISKVKELMHHAVEAGNRVILDMETLTRGEHRQGPGHLLDRISTPGDLKKIPVDKLPQLAEEIRRMIIETVSENGGHLASNLGVVELTIALHYVLNAPEDKLIWDVGHQAYTHKILTGRNDSFHTLRRYGGISGFPKRSESCYDVLDAGHSSTSISVAVGMAESNRLRGIDSKIVAVIGDGAVASGMAMEALNHAGHLNSNLVVVLNDNGMSISKNVGALSAWLSRLVKETSRESFREKIRTVMMRISEISELKLDHLRICERHFMQLYIPGIIFREMGFFYEGPFPGHDVEGLVKKIKDLPFDSGPVLFHVVTRKGRGYAHAENNPTLFHGTGPFDRVTGALREGHGAPTYTKVFGDALTKIAAGDARVVAVSAGMTVGTGLAGFAESFPGRMYDVGIAEQHAVTFAAGMAMEGFRPVVAIYSTFLQRAYDQIIHDVCLQKVPVVFMLDRAGITGEDGPTHHGLFDISFLRCLPNMIVMSPCDENELQHMLFTALHCDHPVAIRFPRGPGLGKRLQSRFKKLPMGKAEVLKDGGDVVIFAIGSTVYPSLEAAYQLEAEGIRCAVINSRFINPVDSQTIIRCSVNSKLVVTVEENVLKGGFGSSVLETLQLSGCSRRVIRIGIPDVFVEQGEQGFLRKKYQIDCNGIKNRIKREIKSGTE